MPKLRWPLIFTVSLSGIIFGLLTVFAVLHGYEYPAGLMLLIAVAGIMAALAPRAAGRNAFAAGFLTVLLAVWTQAALLPLYFENNPSYRDIEIPFGMGARAWTVFSAPIGALVAGTLVMLLAWAAAKLLHRK